MKGKNAIWALGAVFLFGAQLAMAGAPLKGIDVKLGKNPGGGCAAKVSGDSGEVNFGIWTKGNYTVAFSAANLNVSRPERLHVEIRGVTQRAITHVLTAATADTLAPIEIVSDGRTPIVVNVSNGQDEPVDYAVRIKSHSNSTNN